MITDKAQHARSEFDRALRAVVLAVDGEDAFVTRPIFEGATTTRACPNAREALRAARMLRDVANRAMSDYVARCREDGVTWEQLAEELGLADGEAAFQFVAPDEPGSFRPSSFSWRCKACGGRVRDQGPYEAHPANCEPGHADDCTRLAADVERYRREWDDE